MVEEVRPKAVMLENVRGLSTAKFQTYRNSIRDRLTALGYESDWHVLNACEFGVPQLRPRFVLVAAQPEYFARFKWPGAAGTAPTVGEVLYPLMAREGWRGGRGLGQACGWYRADDRGRITQAWRSRSRADASTQRLARTWRRWQGAGERGAN